MAVPDCITIGDANLFLTYDENRMTGQIARALAENYAWMNVLETGTFPAGVSCTQRAVVQESICPVLSQCDPVWNNFDCDLAPQTVCFGSTEYTYSPKQYFEKSCPLCLQTSYCALRNSIKAVEMTYKDHLASLWNSIIRGQLTRLSATKVVADSTATSFSQIVARGFGTNFPAGRTPNSPLTFKFVKYIANYMTNELRAGSEFKWGTGMEQHFRLITDQQTIDNFRNDDSIRQDLRFITSGCCPEKSNLLEYSWMGPYQGVAFAVDPSITRVTGVRPDGSWCCVEPFICEDATKGTKLAFNPAWLAAPYQISYMLAKNSFIREIPEEFLGEGLTKFERQNWGGKVTWHNVIDNCNNITGNKGFHYWQLAAAFRPERPEFVIPILHTRCPDDMGLLACGVTGYYNQCV